MEDSKDDKHMQDDGVAVGKVGSHDVPLADTARVVDPVAERHLCRKFDVRILPVLAVMCEYNSAKMEDASCTDDFLFTKSRPLQRIG
jgi:hypothetical protein